MSARWGIRKNQLCKELGGEQGNTNKGHHGKDFGLTKRQEGDQRTECKRKWYMNLQKMAGASQDMIKNLADDADRSGQIDQELRQVS